MQLKCKKKLQHDCIVMIQVWQYRSNWYYFQMQYMYLHINTYESHIIKAVSP